jgi:hypothetical protein
MNVSNKTQNKPAQTTLSFIESYRYATLSFGYRFVEWKSKLRKTLKRTVIKF